MVGDGLLTPYQAQRLLRGETRGLRIADRYRVLDKIGAGGMGQVFLCEDTPHGRPVAVKVLPADPGPRPGGGGPVPARGAGGRRPRPPGHRPGPRRRRRTGRTLPGAGVRGRGRPVPVRDGPRPARPAGGGPLRRPGGRRPCSAAADKGWVHRDVKPHNLMVDRAGEVKILDLGLARPVTDDSRQTAGDRPRGVRSLLGTADFIAPEQIDRQLARWTSGPTSTRSGRTLYYLLAGRPPFPDGTTAPETRRGIATASRPPIRVRPDVPGRAGRGGGAR